MLQINNSIIKHNVGLLNLVKDLLACKVMYIPMGMFYRYKDLKKLYQIILYKMLYNSVEILLGDPGTCYQDSKKGDDFIMDKFKISNYINIEN